MIRRLIMAAMLLNLCLLAIPSTAAAFDPFNSTCSSGGSTANSAVCTDDNQVQNDPDNSNPISGSNGVLLHITNIVAYVGGAAAVIMLIVGGLRYVTSNGDSNAISSAKNTVVGAVIGLLVIALAASLISYVVKRL